MWRHTRQAGSAIALSLFIALGVYATNAPAQNSGSIPGDTWVRISAFTNQPLAGADVAVFGDDGRLLFVQLNATNSQGIYPAKIANLPANFRVIVTWDPNGQATLQNFQTLGLVVLSADVQHYDPVHGIVFVNP